MEDRTLITEEPARKEPAWKRLLKLLLKITVTILCFWYISGKINWQQTINAIQDANWFLLFAAFMLLVISKIFSAIRLNIHFNNIGLYLSQFKNLRLYWLGMFYNLFLPGAISGDAYKVILLKRNRQAPFKKTSAAVLLDRFSGLLSVGILLAISGWMVLDIFWINALLVFGSLAAVFVLLFMVKKFFPDFIPGYWPAFVWGMGVQLTQVVCVFAILKSLGIETDYATWLFIFLAAAVIAVLPLSLGGGLGTREFVFVTGATYFQLDAEQGVIISLLFYAISAVASLPGLYYVFHEPLGTVPKKTGTLLESP